MSTFEALEGWQHRDGLAGLPLGEADLMKVCKFGQNSAVVAKKWARRRAVARVSLRQIFLYLTAILYLGDAMPLATTCR